MSTITRGHYYPGWFRIVVHATAHAYSGRLLGASLVGEEGAAHRINPVVLALAAGKTRNWQIPPDHHQSGDASAAHRKPIKYL